MLVHAIERILQTLLVLLVISFIAFMMVTTLGDPVSMLLPTEATLAEREALIRQLNLDKSFFQRFLLFLNGFMQGDFGISYRTLQPVGAMILERLPATVELALASFFVTVLVAVPLGILCGVRPDWLISRAIMFVSIAGITLPNFVIGVLLIAIFSVQLGWLPSFGRGQTVMVAGWDTGFLTLSGLKNLILPTLTLASFQMTFVIRMLRAQLMEVGHSEHIRFARARGIGEARIWFIYALRNTLLPVITLLALQLGSIIAFSVVTESVFAWPGLGTLFLQSVQTTDIPVIAVYLIFVGVVYMLINLLVELSYPLIDPRLRARAV